LEAASSATSSQPVAALAATELRVQLRTTPAGARIAMDSTTLAGNPIEVRITPGSEHVFEVTLANYRTVTRKLRIDAETTIDFELLADTPADDESSVRQSTPTRRAKAARTVAVVPASTEVSPDGTAADPVSSEAVPAYDDPCQPPFYFKAGIKMYKPECLK
ncbi:MAG TPA: PEGA domain-containing protein, partial [Polyangiaceae bacterium]